MNNWLKGALVGCTMGAALWGAAAYGEGEPAQFAAAKPVWPAGEERTMNASAGFAATFEVQAGEQPELRVTGCSLYRIWLNGKFVGYGPTRAAKGFFRVETWPLAAAVRPGKNVLAIEANVFNCNNFYICSWPGFLQAEVVNGGKVLVKTGADGDFAAGSMSRLQKVSRSSFQRAFSEAYRMSVASEAWRTNGVFASPLKLAEQPAQKLVERVVPGPKLAPTHTFKPLKLTQLETVKPQKYRGDRCIDRVRAPRFLGYQKNEQDANLWYDVQEVRITGEEKIPEATGGTPVVPVAGWKPVAGGKLAAGWKLAAGRGVLFDNGLEDSGFPGAKVVVTKPCRLWFAFDEILRNGAVDPLRLGYTNAVRWELQPGEYDLEVFETYTLRYLHVYVTEGEATVSSPFLRTYRNPIADRAKLESSDPELDRVFAAARETYAQNTVDVFTDCPHRERAGWLCDSYFTARSSLLLSGGTAFEQLFLQNYLLPEKFDDIPEGMLPMCYPSDHTDKNFIPNWAMWFVIELDEFRARGGDPALVAALKPRLVKLVDYLKRFRNSDGLLEKLPAWVFVEWSRANHLVQDVNYPSNMTWAEVLDCMDRLYGMPELAKEAAKVRETVRKQSWTGKWFCDNARRGKDGKLTLSGECTETCQYYAFFFKTATPETYPELWQTLLQDFGPKRFSADRKQLKAHKEIWPSNAFIGNYLRLALLSRARLDQQLLDETKGYFVYMADRTGTLWENDTDYASCNHGFASHAAVFYAQNVVGVVDYRPDRRTLTVRKTPPALKLEYCRLTLPLAEGEVVYGWVRTANGVKETFTAPKGWRLEHK